MLTLRELEIDALTISLFVGLYPNGHLVSDAVAL
jgi:hypothetical protein